jgi:hypothetical protein
MLWEPLVICLFSYNTLAESQRIPVDMKSMPTRPSTDLALPKKIFADNFVRK